MAKVKYNVKGVDTSDFTPVKPGMYIAKVEEINDWSGQHGAGMEVVLSVVSDSQGKKKDIDGIGSKLWTYIYFDHEPSAFRLAEFVKAFGLKESGTLDTEKLLGKEIQVRVKPDRNEDGEYRPRVGKLLALAAEAEAGEDEPEEPDDEPDEDEDEDEVDLDSLDRAGLKKLIKENELEIKVTKSKSEDDLRAEIAAAMSEDEDEDEPEEDEPEDEEDEDEVDLDTLDRAALKKFIKDNELDVKVTKSMSEDDIRAAIAEAAGEGEDDDDDDEEEEGDEAPDYNSWDAAKLKAELQERGIEVEGRFAKSKAVKALKEDDADDSEPF